MNSLVANYLDLDFKSIQIFLKVIETSSVTQTANEIGLTQSAVSHSIDRLRDIFQDPLFIRAGRGIIPTTRAVQLSLELSKISKQVKQLSTKQLFIPEEASIHWTISANDFQRDVCLPDFYRLISSKVKKFSLEIIPSDYPTIEMFREQNIDLMLSPICPDAKDIYQRKLFTDQLICFYDASVREAPVTEEDFLKSHYISLSFLHNKKSMLNDGVLNKKQAKFHQQVELKTKIRVSNFSGIANFLTGTDLLTWSPSALGKHALSQFASCPLPYDLPPLNMYMLWHERQHEDPAHIWLRNEMVGYCQMCKESCTELQFETIHQPI